MEADRGALPIVIAAGAKRVDVVARRDDRPRMPDLQPIIETLRARVSIADLVAGAVELEPAGDMLRERCSAHRDEAKALNVYPASGTHHCFSCGRGGEVVRWTRETSRCSEEDAITLLCARIGLPPPVPGL